MTVDTRALRAVAEAALADSDPVWTYIDGPLIGDVHVETRPQSRGHRPGRSKIRVDPNTIGPFIAAASPGTILALLDEVDGSRGADAHWEHQQRVDALEEKLAIATRALAEAVAIFDATWCPEHGHAPKPDQLARVEELRKLVSSS